MTSLLLATGHSAAAHAHSGRLILALLPLLIVALAVDVYCVIDLARAESVRHLPKIVWAIIIVFVSFPLGAVLYLFAGRVRNRGFRVPG